MSLFTPYGWGMPLAHLLLNRPRVTKPKTCNA
ncbi:protein of unknown function [Cupriavidus taiwanensis]|nr:protein of unknown function [Cupriavidus taiwanensis]